VPGYDYGAELAKDGHVSIAIDRLGYGDSTGPDGNAICWPAQADITDQIIRDMRSGGYRTGEGQGPRFARVALLGHSAGGLIAEMTQYSYKSADALGILAYTDRFASPLAIETLAQSDALCVMGGEPRDAGGPAHYAYFGQTDADFRAAHLYNVEPAVGDWITAHRVRDPCGDLISGFPSFGVNEPLVNTITVPVLLVTAAHDALFPPPGGDLQQITGFSASKDVDRFDMAGSGHALTLSREAPTFRAKVGTWLTDHGL
jgi:pimeloyl-ACP methyl ester carboxylesterase